MRCFALIAVLLISTFAPAVPAFAQTGSGCQFILGFATLHALDPAFVGNCIDNQAFASNGDALQHTTNGLLAWRKADNWTAFTNGDRTLINGPDGGELRQNDQRYSWEAAGGWTGVRGCTTSRDSRTYLNNQCIIPADDPNGALDVVMLTFVAPDSPIAFEADSSGLTPQLLARLNQINGTLGSAGGPGPPGIHAILMQSEGGLPNNLLFSPILTADGVTVDIAAGNFQDLSVVVLRTADGWKINDVKCPYKPAISLMASSRGFLGCAWAV